MVAQTVKLRLRYCSSTKLEEQVRGNNSLRYVDAGPINNFRTPSRDHFWLVYTYQLNPPLGTAKTDVPLQSGQPYGYSGIHGQFDRSSLLWRMAVGVGGVCSLTSEALVNLNKGVPPPAYFDWRGWFTAGLPSSGMTLRCSALILPHGSR
ncbi:hypothetical protein J6590_014050 [Homalodisca vitripennis]|nr:hypothetical protein J6590_014050 [Homalodisca vitripennis]